MSVHLIGYLSVNKLNSFDVIHLQQVEIFADLVVNPQDAMQLVLQFQMCDTMSEISLPEEAFIKKSDHVICGHPLPMPFHMT